MEADGFPFQYGHADLSVDSDHLLICVGIGVRGLTRIRDGRGMPGVIVSGIGEIRPSDGPSQKASMALLLTTAAAGVLLAKLRYYGEQSGTLAFMESEADRATAEMKRMGHNMMDGTRDRTVKDDDERTD